MSFSWLLFYALITIVDPQDPWGVAKNKDGLPYFHDSGFNIGIECDGTFYFVLLQNSPLLEDFRRTAQSGDTVSFNMGAWHWRGKMTLDGGEEESAFFVKAELGPELIPALRQPQSQLAIHAPPQTINIDFRNSFAAQDEFAEACRNVGQ